LIAIEIMDCQRASIPCFFAWANGMDNVANHLEGLEGYHYFVIFRVISNQHKDSFCSHGETPDEEGKLGY
jgi:hypothetical protein